MLKGCRKICGGNHVGLRAKETHIMDTKFELMSQLIFCTFSTHNGNLCFVLAFVYCVSFQLLKGSIFKHADLAFPPFYIR